MNFRIISLAGIYNVGRKFRKTNFSMFKSKLNQNLFFLSGNQFNFVFIKKSALRYLQLGFK